MTAVTLAHLLPDRMAGASPCEAMLPSLPSLNVYLLRHRSNICSAPPIDPCPSLSSRVDPNRRFPCKADSRFSSKAATPTARRLRVRRPGWGSSAFESRGHLSALRSDPGAIRPAHCSPFRLRLGSGGPQLGHRPASINRSTCRRGWTRAKYRLRRVAVQHDAAPETRRLCRSGDLAPSARERLRVPRREHRRADR